MGEINLGAFSCDELARIADEEFEFGNVLAGTYRPEGEEVVWNCPVGYYCPDTVSILVYGMVLCCLVHER